MILWELQSESLESSPIRPNLPESTLLEFFKAASKCDFAASWSDSQAYNGTCISWKKLWTMCLESCSSKTLLISIIFIDLCCSMSLTNESAWHWVALQQGLYLANGGWQGSITTCQARYFDNGFKHVGAVLKQRITAFGSNLPSGPQWFSIPNSQITIDIIDDPHHLSNQLRSYSSFYLSAKGETIRHTPKSIAQQGSLQFQLLYSG